MKTEHFTPIIGTSVAFHRPGESPPYGRHGTVERLTGAQIVVRCRDTGHVFKFWKATLLCVGSSRPRRAI